jgi:iron complex transport system substrate-binding protein
MRSFLRFSLLLWMLPACAAIANVSALDDTGRTVTLDKPAQRIISLAPHATELLFEAGAGKLLVGVSEYSDYPEQAKKIASIGNIFALDLERMLALKPDLVVVWGTGNARMLAKKLRDSHIKVFESEPRDFEMVASSIERLGVLAGTDASARAAATTFRNRLAALRKTYQVSDPQRIVSVFYQVWHTPLMTLNDQHMVSSAIRLCGGKNIFGSLKEISPTVNTEAVLAANPQAIITAGDKKEALANWLPFTSMTAVKKGHLFTVNGDWINRAGPRILDGTEALCKHLAKARTQL